MYVLILNLLESPTMHAYHFANRLLYFYSPSFLLSSGQGPSTEKGRRSILASYPKLVSNFCSISMSFVF